MLPRHADPGPAPAPPPEAGARTAADCAHELRGSLHSLLIWTEVLERRLGDAPEPVARALAGIRRAVQEQARVIDRLEARR